MQVFLKGLRPATLANVVRYLAKKKREVIHTVALSKMYKVYYIIIIVISVVINIRTFFQIKVSGGIDFLILALPCKNHMALYKQRQPS